MAKFISVEPQIDNILYNIEQLDLVVSCDFRGSTYERNKAWADTYPFIERVLKALLAFEGVIVIGTWALKEPDPMHIKVLEAFDNAHSLFHELLGLETRNPIRRFGQKPKPKHNPVRVTLEQLRSYYEWFYTPELMTTSIPQYYGILVECPRQVDLRGFFAPIMHILIEALGLCLERIQKDRATAPSQKKSVPSDAEPLRATYTTSVSSGQLAWSNQLEQSASKTSKPIASKPALPITNILASPSTTSQIKTKVLEKMAANPEFRPKRNGASFQPSSVQMAPPQTLPILLSRPNDAQPVSLAPNQSRGRDPPKPEISHETPIRGGLDATLDQNRNQSQEIAYLKQELENEKTQRAVDNNLFQKSIKNRNDKLKEADENYKTLLARFQEADHSSKTLLAELEAVEASKAELGKVLQDTNKAKEVAKHNESVARLKLQLTWEVVASLKKEAEVAREEGREDIRHQLSFALMPIFDPNSESEKPRRDAPMDLPACT